MGQTRRELLYGMGVAAFTSSVAGCSQQKVSDKLPTNQFRNNLKNTGYVDRTIPDEVVLDWSIPTNTGDHTASKGSPIVTSNGNILVADDTGRMRSITPEGDINWSTNFSNANRGSHGTPAIANGKAYIGSYEGIVSALDVRTGKIKWQNDIGDAIGASPTYYNNKLYIAVEHSDPSGSLAILDAKTGSILKQDHWPTDHPHSTIAIDLDNNVMLLGSNDGYVYAWEFSSVDRLWKYNTGGEVKAPIAISNGIAVAPSWSNYLTGIDVRNGVKKWEFKAEDDIMCAPAIHNNKVYTGSHDWSVYSVGLNTGKLLWEYSTNGWVTGSAVVTPKHVLVGSEDYHLYAFDKQTGSVTWSFKANGFVTSAPAVTKNAIYFTERARYGNKENPGMLYRLVPG